MKPIASLILAAITLFLCACHSKCEYGHRSITISNKTETEKMFQVSFNRTDSFIDYWQGHTVLQSIKSNSVNQIEVDDGSPCWELCLKGQTMNIYIVDAELYEKYSKSHIDTLRKYVPVLKKYNLKLEDLEKLNWTVVYP